MLLTPSAENKAEADKGKIKGVPQVGFRDSKESSSGFTPHAATHPGSIFSQLVTVSIIILRGKKSRNGGNQSI